MFYISNVPGQRFLTSKTPDKNELLNDLKSDMRDRVSDMLTGRVGIPLQVPVENMAVGGESMSPEEQAAMLNKMLEAKKKGSGSRLLVILALFLFFAVYAYGVSLQNGTFMGEDIAGYVNSNPGVAISVLLGCFAIFGVSMLIASVKIIKSRSGCDIKLYGKCIGYLYHIKKTTNNRITTHRLVVEGVPVFEYYYNGRTYRATDDAYSQNTSRFPEVNETQEIWIKTDNDGTIYTNNSRRGNINQIVAVVVMIALCVAISVISFIV